MNHLPNVDNLSLLDDGVSVPVGSGLNPYLSTEKLLENASLHMPVNPSEWEPVHVAAWFSITLSCPNVAMNALHANLSGAQLLIEPTDNLQKILFENVENAEFNSANTAIQGIAVTKNDVLPVDQLSSSSDDNIDRFMNNLDMSGIDFIRKANSTLSGTQKIAVRTTTTSESQGEERIAIPVKITQDPPSYSQGSNYFETNEYAEWPPKPSQMSFLEQQDTRQFSYDPMNPLAQHQSAAPLMSSTSMMSTMSSDRRYQSNSPSYFGGPNSTMPSYPAPATGPMVAYPNANYLPMNNNRVSNWIPQQTNINPQYPFVNQQPQQMPLRESDNFGLSFDQLSIRDSNDPTRQPGYPRPVYPQPNPQMLTQFAQMHIQQQGLMPSYLSVPGQRPPVLTMPQPPQLITRSPPRQQTFRQVNHPEVFPTATDIIYQVQFKRTFLYFVYYGEPTQAFEAGDFVITECDRGEDLGMIVNIINLAIYHEHKHRDIKFLDEEVFRIRQIVRLANRYEREQLPIKYHDEQTVLQHCIDVIRNVFMLPMNVIDAEYQFDRTKLSVYYVSDVRIDFREIVRHVFSTFQTRIWMKKSNRELNFEPIAYAATALTTGIAPNKAALYRGDLVRNVEGTGVVNYMNSGTTTSNNNTYSVGNVGSGSVGGVGYWDVGDGNGF